jgi:hypothetical protein
MNKEWSSKQQEALLKTLKTRFEQHPNRHKRDYFFRAARVIQWENGLGGSGGLKRILGSSNAAFQAKKSKKSVRIRPIRSIRSPIVSHPFLSCTKMKLINIVYLCTATYQGK